MMMTKKVKTGISSRMGFYSRESPTYLQLCPVLVQDFCKNGSRSCHQLIHQSVPGCTLECCSNTVNTQVSHQTTNAAAFIAFIVFYLLFPGVLSICYQCEINHIGTVA